MMKIRNLNKGQRLGVGRARVSFPGLSSYVLDNQAKTKANIQKFDEEKLKSYRDGVAELHKRLSTKRARQVKQTPMERGWTGASLKGKKFGTPLAPNPELKFDNFESILIDQNFMSTMTGNLGRVRSIKLVMVTGNRNGTAGFATTRAKSGRGPYMFQRTANRAGLRVFKDQVMHISEKYIEGIGYFSKNKFLLITCAT